MKLADLHKTDPVAHKLHFAVRIGTFATADQAAEAFSIRPLGESWRDLNRDTAAEVLVAVLREDMAFGYPRMEDSILEEAIEEFFGLFSPEARYFTNGNWEQSFTPWKFGGGGFGPQWTPATPATFDGGLIAIDSDKAGIFWLEDED